MGIGYWSVSDCRPDVQWWMSADKTQCWYSRAGWGTYLVWGNFLRTYEANGWECGWLGAPLNNRYRSGAYERQDFEGGYIYRLVA